MGFIYFVIGVLVGVFLLVLLPVFIAALGVVVAIGIVIALPLIAALLIALWTSDRKRRQSRWPVSRDRWR